MIRFGPSGNSKRFYDEGYKASEEAPEWLFKQGLNAYEYSFGRGVRLSRQKAELIGAEAKKYDISLSVHAPYYINLANPDPEKIAASIMYVMSSLEMLDCMGGERCVIHLASAAKCDRAKAIKATSDNLNLLLEAVYAKGYDKFKICPETMGKYVQIGTVEEILMFCTQDKILYPCFDFGHINCYTKGGLKTPDDYKKIFTLTKEALGEKKCAEAHIHFSKIQYGNSGEIRHLDFTDTVYGPDFAPLAKTLKSLRLTPHVLCESAENMADDALSMKQMYNQA